MWIIRDKLAGLGIGKKILLVFLMVGLLSLFVAGFSISSLKRLTGLTHHLVMTDVPMGDDCRKLLDLVYEEELYGRKFTVRKSSDTLVMFWKKYEDFNEILNGIPESSKSRDIPVKAISAAHENYAFMFLEEMEHIGRSDPLSQRHWKRVTEMQDSLVNMLHKKLGHVELDIKEDLSSIEEIGNKAISMSIVIASAGFVSGFMFIYWISSYISKATNTLTAATRRIAEGRFDYKDMIANKDELGELSVAFDRMSGRLKQLEEMYLDASPLTRLPGGIAIENIAEKRLASGGSMAFCHMDLDNFKAFNDHYGYSSGSEVIKKTAELVKESVAKKGTSEDFVGHIGGDDFVLISTPERFEGICSYLVSRFDEEIRKFYSPEDVRKGYIPGKTRQGQEMLFPLMTITIAVVTNRERVLKGVAEIGEIAAELKDYAKTIPGSKYIVDKRKT